MSETFINKVAESGLISLDLAQYIPSNEIVIFDIKPFLFMELILKEKDFRASLNTIDWSQYQDKIIGIFCSTDAIIPMWANMLIVSKLSPFAKSVYFGNESTIRDLVLLEAIQKIDASVFADQRIVVKGCGDMPIGESAYIAITQKLRPVAKSIMYGEPCSTVPVYKKK
ncbi:MAG: DUF2480 family protein [Sediminibacterium sp.]|nr:DUF2480 family protein [Sediminibacterium sp.]